MKVVTKKYFMKRFYQKIITQREKDYKSLQQEIEPIIEAVKKNKDKAVFSYAKKFDNVELTANNLAVSSDEITEAYNALSSQELAALDAAAENIRLFHEAQKKEQWSYDYNGSRLGQLIRPYNSVGIYAPGGRAPYPSSVLMCAIPAKVAGVKSIYVCTPAKKELKLSSGILVAADLAGVERIYRAGGVQAIAGLAYGTETIPSVEKIVGPGNCYVNGAKMLVRSQVAIDLPAGPSEVMIVADEKANPKFLAADLLAQAEHDTSAVAILITSSKKLIKDVQKEIKEQKEKLSRKEVIEKALEKFGMIILVSNIMEAIPLINRLAPEHLSLQVEKPRELLPEIQNAGAIFLGKYTPIAFGDYSSGLNHVLPTGGTARMYSGLTTNDFYKTINFLECTSDGYKSLQEITVTLASMEGLDAHVQSVRVREKGG
jgi:histidinol dehydrogenase